jgi:uncharacterized protein YdeI (YjbR/CyaY-like superfamily)
MRFQTELEIIDGAHGMWMVAHMPFDVRAEFGSGGIVRVQGDINGFPFHSSLFPHRSGRHFLMVNRKMRQGAQVSEPGDQVEITLEMDRAPKTVKLPLALRKAIDANPAAKKFFDEMPPSSQRYRADMVNDVKTAAGKQRKSEAIVKHMADTGASMQKTPEFVKKAIAKYPVAQARWQKLAKSHKKVAMIYLMDGKTQATREHRAEKLARVLVEKGHF